MTEHQPAPTTDKPIRKSILGPKSWIALISVFMFVLATLVMVTGVLNAKPSFDPTVHTDAIAMANSQQPDPKAPSRYPELVEALANFDVAMDDIAEEVVPDVDRPPGKKSVTFEPLLTSLDEDTIGYGFIRDYITDATAAVETILERGLFDPVEELPDTPNLANPYLKGLDASGITLPIGDWSDRLFLAAKEYAFTVAGCAKVLADGGRIDDAAELINRNIRLSDVFLRQSTYSEQVHGGYSIAEIMAWAMENLLARQNLTEQALSKLQEAHAQLSKFQPYKHYIRSTALEIRDDLYRSHTASGRYVASAGWDNVPRKWHERGKAESFVHDFHGRYFTPNRESRLLLLDELLKPVGDIDVETDIAKRRILLIQFRAGFENAGKHYDVLYHHGNSIERSIRNENGHRGKVIALGILLAMAEHRLDHGAWPETVEQLVPDYLDAIPINPLTGDPFEYAHAAGEPPSLESFGFEYKFKY